MSVTEHATTLFSNVRVFDSQTPALSPSSNVLVRDCTIERISCQPITPAPGEHRTEIECGGKILMPGLIDAHWHAMLASLPLKTLLTADLGYSAAAARRRGRDPVRRPGQPREIRPVNRRNRSGLSARQETRCQSRLGHRHPIRRRSRRPPGPPIGKNVSLVRAGRSAEDGHCRQRRPMCDVGQPQSVSLPARPGRRRSPRRPTSCRR
jgi:hypothetical protein